MSSRFTLPFVRCVALGALLALALPRGFAVPPADSHTIVNHIQDDATDVTDFFDTVLPSTLRQRNLSLDFSPKFSDIRSEEFIRIPFAVRYDISDYDQILVGMTPFMPNPINSGWNHRWGLGEAVLGWRHDTVNGIWFLDQATYGIDTRIPLGKPPIDVNEGYMHIQPYLTGMRRLPWNHTKFFISLSYDRELHTPTRDLPTDPRVIRQNIAEIDPGIIYKPTVYGYFFEYEFRHFGEEDGAHLSHGEKLGVIWDVPREQSKGWHIPGKWQIEVAAKTVEEEGHSISYGIVTQIRLRTTLHEVLSSDLAHHLTP